MSSFYLCSVYILVVSEALDQISLIKTYTGYRIDPSSVLEIYYHDLVVAIVEIGDNNAFLNCELVEIDDDEIREQTLKNMSSINKLTLLTLDKMIELMDRCDQLDPLRVTPEEAWCAAFGVNYSDQVNFTIPKKATNVTSFLIAPGTKWCGSGDKATTYFDLGSEVKLDVCCRTHDLCPAKIVSNSTRYNLTNESKYTRSHCSCDVKFHSCLKMVNYTIGYAMGYFYFNMLGMECFDERNGKMVFDLPPPY